MTGPRLAQSPLYQFFVANPDEELTIEDVAAKFGVGRRAAGMLIYRLVGHRAIEYERIARLPAKVRQDRIAALEAKIAQQHTLLVSLMVFEPPVVTP